MLEDANRKELIVEVCSLDQKECEQILKKYGNTKGDEMIISNSVYKLIVGEAIRLITTMNDRGATKDELTKAKYYLRVCIDSKKYNLNYIRYRQENGIEQLAAKYGINLRKWKKVA